MKQSEAMRLANELDAYHTAPHHKQAAAELRRLSETLAAQPAPVQEPVAWPMEEQPDGSIIPVDPSELPSDYFTTPPAQPAPVQEPVQEPVRIYDYVWPQRDEHKEDCVYACSYTPGHHLARGELLAVVHPSQLKSAYLQRDDEDNPLNVATPPAQRQWVGLTDEDKLTVRRMPWETLGDLMDNTEAKLKEKNT
jgi:hypothetical protein